VADQKKEWLAIKARSTFVSQNVTRIEKKNQFTTYVDRMSGKMKLKEIMSCTQQ
jgi:hypothetical protein